MFSHPSRVSPPRASGWLRTTGVHARALLLIVGPMVAASCAPRLRPLAGAPTVARLPSTELPPSHRQIVFDWELVDRDVTGRGEGVARVAGPDSARLDFFLAGGFGSGAAILIADSLRTPGSGLLRRFIPPPPLLWAALAEWPFLRCPTRRPALTASCFVPTLESRSVGASPFVATRLSASSASATVASPNGSSAVATSSDYRSEEARRALSLTIKRARRGPAVRCVDLAVRSLVS